MRKSFIFYNNWSAMIEELPDDAAGRLIKIICHYQTTGEILDDDKTLVAIFKSIQPILDEDNKKYVAKVERINELNRRRNDNVTKTNEVVTKSSRNRNDNVGVNVNDNVNDNVISKDIYKDDIKVVVDYLNEKSRSNFTVKNEQTRKSITARLKEGYTVEDFKIVIDAKVKDWSDDDKMKDFLRPQTLFRPSNFEAYLNAARRPKKNGFKQNSYDFDELEKMLISN